MNNEKKDYFTDDIRAAIREMSSDDMRTNLKALEGTPYWFAILKYTLDRIAVIQDSFLTLDPVKEPSKISQYQGIITGMLDLQDAVLSLKFESKKAEDPNTKEEEAKNDLGGAYGKY
ncbi:MAG: hypothetical protein WC917_03710 [Bacilli bacterium]|jgi:hypothetical protein